jgi:hypothetical protein
MTTSVANFLDTLRDSRLLEPGRLEEISRTPEAGDVDAPTLAVCLVQLGWLTTYQVEELLQGRAAGLTIGSYRIEDRLGESGLAFKARHPEQHGRLVLKIIANERWNDSNIAQRLQQDVRAASQLAHPNIARVRDLERLGDRHVYVREYVEGTDLARLVQDKGVLPVNYACDYIHQAAQGLQHAHERGLPHGHLVGSNLVVMQSGSLVGAVGNSDATAAAANGLPTKGSTLKIVDFGLAALHDGGPASVNRDLADLGRVLALLISGQNVAGAADLDSAIAGREIPPELHLLTLRLLLVGQAPEAFTSMGQVVQAMAPLCGSDSSAAPAPADLIAEPPTAAAPAPPPPVVPPPAPPPPLALAEEPKLAQPATPEPKVAQPIILEAVPPPPPVPAPPPPKLEVPPPITPTPARPPAAVPPGKISAFLQAASAPPAEAVPSGFVPAEHAPVLTAPMAEVPVEEAPVEEAAPPLRRPSKYGPKFYFWAAVGLLLHLIAAAILIIAIMNWMGQSSKPGPTFRQRPAPTQPKSKSQPKGMSEHQGTAAGIGS